MQRPVPIALFMAYDFHLHFRDRSLSLINSYVSASAYTSSCSFVSLATKTGLGSDFACLLHWIGSRVLNAVSNVIIRHRLVTISKFITRREKCTGLNQKRFDQLQEYSADLLELCRPDYSLKTRKKSLNLILALLQPPMNDYTVLLFESDFVEMLTVVTQDCATTEDGYLDSDLFTLGRCVMEIIHTTNVYRAFHCVCDICLNFNGELKCQCSSPCCCIHVVNK